MRWLPGESWSVFFVPKPREENMRECVGTALSEVLKQVDVEGPNPQVRECALVIYDGAIDPNPNSQDAHPIIPFGIEMLRQDDRVVFGNETVGAEIARTLSALLDADVWACHVYAQEPWSIGEHFSKGTRIARWEGEKILTSEFDDEDQETYFSDVEPEEVSDGEPLSVLGRLFGIDPRWLWGWSGAGEGADGWGGLTGDSAPLQVNVSFQPRRPQPLSVTIKDVNPSRQAVSFVVSGQIDAGLPKILANALEEALRKRYKRIVLDLSGLEFIGEEGIRGLMDYSDRLQAAGGRLVLARVREGLATVLSLLGLGAFFEVVSTS
ncbi:MAG: STAS domain-containing protein [Planctomycetes bacterium]|nr:STAS domain-containing protein [Planctomycetota bacterium]